jgi:hypothetical protein
MTIPRDVGVAKERSTVAGDRGMNVPRDVGAARGSFGIPSTALAMPNAALGMPSAAREARRARGMNVPWGARAYFNSGIVWREVERGARRSPTFSTRASTVRIVNSRGSSLALTSLHRRGVETGAPSFARMA